MQGKKKGTGPPVLVLQLLIWSRIMPLAATISSRPAAAIAISAQHGCVPHCDNWYLSASHDIETVVAQQLTRSLITTSSVPHA